MSLRRESKPKDKNKSLEGKTTTSVTSQTICHGCDENEAIVFCNTCVDPLCKPCGKSHTRYVGKGHILTDLTDMSSFTLSKMIPKSAEEDPSLNECVHHMGHDVSRICTTCRVLVCDICAKGNVHRGHEIIPFDQAASVMYEMCASEVKILMDAIANIERLPNHNNEIEHIIKAMDILKQEHRDLTQAIDTRVSSSLINLNEMKAMLTTVNTTSQTESAEKCELVENVVTQLHSARKSRDISFMASNLNMSAHILKSIDDYTKSHNKQPIFPIQSAEQLIPGLKTKQNLFTETANAFKVHIPEIVKSKYPLDPKFSYRKLKKTRQVDFEMHFAVSIVQPIGSGLECDSIIVYAGGTENCLKVNYLSGKVVDIMTSFETEAPHFIPLTGTRFIATEFRRNTIHLLDDNLNSLCKIDQPKDVDMFCRLDSNRFVAYSGSSKTFFIYQATEDSLQPMRSVKIPDMCSLSSMIPTPMLDTVLCIDDSNEGTDVTLVNIQTNTLTRHSLCGKHISRPFVDDCGNLLFISDKQIHIYSNILTGLNKCQTLNDVVVADVVIGLARVGKNLVVGYENHIEIYAEEHNTC